MCSFVQSELDCLLPGGERVMVLLSSHSEMDSSTERGGSVSRMYSTAEKHTAGNAGSVSEEVAAAELKRRLHLQRLTNEN